MKIPKKYIQEDYIFKPWVYTYKNKSLSIVRVIISGLHRYNKYYNRHKDQLEGEYVEFIGDERL